MPSTTLRFMTSPTLLTIPFHRLRLTPGSIVIIPDVTWEQYEQLLANIDDARSYRLTYYQNSLEIAMPSEAHEILIRLMDWIISTFCEELGLNLKTIGSTTLKAKALDTSPEPDNGYYIQNEPLVRGKAIDLSQDPPPDLVVEINISNTDTNKKAIYQTLKVPEFWIYNDKTRRLSFYRLQSGEYQLIARSVTFPLMEATTVHQLMEACDRDGELLAKKQFRLWVQQQI
jgi:Uma2 family endonuclease